MTYINSITICPENVTIKKGRWYYNTYAEICPTNATCKCLAWHSSNSNVASVNEDGDICGVSEGVAVVYATAQDGSGAVGFCTVTVVAPVMVESVTVTPHSRTVTVGDTFGLSATVCPQNADDKRIRWTSCDCNIAEVDSLTGCVTAKSAGNVCICANAIDGSGVHGCCEVTCNIPGVISSGTDSIGVFQTLSALSATPEDAETGAPDLLGVQFRERQDGNYDIRFVSQINNLNYKSVGYEIYSKFGDTAPVSNVLCSKVVYCSFIAAGKTISADEGYYFVVGVIENVPPNTVASFKITPFAITSEGECLYGNTILFSCKNAEVIDDVDFETPEHSGTSSHIRVNTGNGSNLNMMSSPGENGTVLGQFADGQEITLVHETPQNGKWYHVYGEMVDGSSTCGWCSGEYLEKEVTFLKSVRSDNIMVRRSMSTNSEIIGKMFWGDHFPLLKENSGEGSGYKWNKIKFNGVDGYVFISSTVNNYEIVNKKVFLAYACNQTSEAGIEMLKTLEGYRSRAYKPFTNETLWTIGYGHLITEGGTSVWINGEEYEELNEELATILLRDDLTNTFERRFNNFLQSNNVRLNQFQYDACIMDAFQKGQNIWQKGEREIVKFILANQNFEDYEEVLAAFIDGATKDGWVNRRTKEAQLFVNQVYS